MVLEAHLSWQTCCKGISQDDSIINQTTHVYDCVVDMFDEPRR